MASVAMSNAPTSLQAGRPGTRAHWNPRRRPTASYCNPDAEQRADRGIGGNVHRASSACRQCAVSNRQPRTQYGPHSRHQQLSTSIRQRRRKSPNVSVSSFAASVQYCKPCAVRQSEHQPVLARTAGHPGKYSKPRPAAVCRRRQTHDVLPSGGSILRPLRPR